MNFLTEYFKLREEAQRLLDDGHHHQARVACQTAAELWAVIQLQSSSQVATAKYLRNHKLFLELRSSRLEAHHGN